MMAHFSRRFICLMLAFVWMALPLTAQAQGGVTVTDAQIQKAIEDLDKRAQNEIKENAVPGMAIAIVFRDKTIFARGYGVKDTTTNEPVDADTVFQLASLSKPLGATVIAELVGEGKITWDSKISELDPSFALYDPYVTRELTIRDLYAHKSGLPEHIGDLMEDLEYTRADILHRLRFQKPASSFRTHFAYTNFGMTEGAVAAAKAYGLEWQDAAEQKLYQPLGMDATSSNYSDFVARTNKALGHVLVNGKWVQKFTRDPDSESPAGGVSSSVNDLTLWMRLQLNKGKFGGKQLVDEVALTETHTPQILTGSSQIFGTPTFYGLGWDIGIDNQGRMRLSHSGAFASGTGTVANLVPGQELGIVILTNGSPLGVAEGLAATFLNNALETGVKIDLLQLYKDAYTKLLQALVGGDPVYAKPPAAPSPALKNEAYLGTFANDFFGDIRIVEGEGGLAIVQGPKEKRFPLTHFDRDVFTYETVGESAVGRTGVVFTIGSDGKAESVRVENLDVHGSGWFQRVP